MELQHKVNYHYCCHLQAWHLYSYLKQLMAGLLKDKEMAEFSDQSSSWKITLEPLTGNVVISDVDAVTYVVLSEA